MSGGSFRALVLVAAVRTTLTTLGESPVRSFCTRVLPRMGVSFDRILLFPDSFGSVLRCLRNQDLHSLFQRMAALRPRVSATVLSRPKKGSSSDTSTPSSLKKREMTQRASLAIRSIRRRALTVRLDLRVLLFWSQLGVGLFIIASR